MSQKTVITKGGAFTPERWTCYIVSILLTLAVVATIVVVSVDFGHKLKEEKRYVVVLSIIDLIFHAGRSKVSRNFFFKYCAIQDIPQCLIICFI